MKIFIHGLESSGQGFKGKFFKNIFPDILTPDFVGDFHQRMEKLSKILKNKTNLIIIGSSFGGLMATKFASENENQIKKLILLAPALSYNNILSDSFKINVPTIIFHGKNDEVVPLFPVKKKAEKIFNNLKFYEVEDDHYLHKTVKKIDWKSIIL